MKVEFKNVNQGDSILITWESNGITRYGIIDCHADNNNPILKEIATISPKEIDFIIVSHPHFDHFSGFVDLFEFLRNSGIRVKYLGLTFDAAICSTYQMFQSYGKQQALHDFFELIFSASDIIEEVVEISSNSKNLVISEDAELIFRAPHFKEKAKLAVNMAKILSRKLKSSPDYNLYSTIIELRVGEDSVLFTSDAPSQYFDKLNSYFSRIGSPKFRLVQIPHHGSRNNYSDSFWRMISRHPNCPAIFSVGNEPRDRLPNYDVVESVDMNGYKVFSTNPVYGIREFYLKNNVRSSINEVSVSLNHVSKLKRRHFFGAPVQFFGDQVFVF